MRTETLHIDKNGEQLPGPSNRRTKKGLSRTIPNATSQKHFILHDRPIVSVLHAIELISPKCDVQRGRRGRTASKVDARKFARNLNIDSGTRCTSVRAQGFQFVYIQLFRLLLFVSLSSESSQFACELRARFSVIRLFCLSQVI